MKRYLFLSLVMLLALAAVAATIVGSRGTFTTTVTGTRMTTTYTPAFMSPACSNIYMAQTCRDRDQNGNLIKPKDYQTTAFEHLQDDMTPGGTYIDHVVCEKDPYYNGEDQGKDTNSAGFQSESIVIPTTMSDRPYYGDNIFPDGVTTITSTFEVCAVCQDDGRILDCFTWTYTRTQGSGNNGTTVSGTSAQEPSDEFKKAKKKFENTHLDGAVCSEELAELFPEIANLTPGGIVLESPIQPGQPSVLDLDIVNTSGVDVFNVQYDVLLDGMYLTSGFVPEIPFFDFETSPIELPPLELGPHTLMVVLDPLNEIPEYAEDDNIDLLDFEVNEESAVPDHSRRTLVMEMLKPNPTFGRFQVLLRLGSESRARLSVVDVRGRIVQSRTIQGSPEVMRTESFHLDSNLGAGVYFLRVEQDGYIETRKFIMLK